MNSSSMLTRADRVIVHVLIAGVVLPLLDATVVNVALDDIGRQLKAPLAWTQWIVTGYALAAASSVAASSWAARRWGARRVWLSCLWLFLLGVVLSALAWNVQALVLARVLQGIATGLMLPTMQTIVVRAVGEDKAKAALTAMAVPSVVAPILGPLVAGLVLAFTSWRMVFWLHVPIGLWAIFLAWRWLPPDGPAERIGFDARGFALLCPGMVLAVLGLSTLDAAMTAPGPSGAGAIGLVVAGALLIMGFVSHARTRGAAALIDLTPWEHASFRAASHLLLLSSIVYYGGLLLLPLYLIQAGGYSPHAAGWLLALHGVGTLLARQRLSAAARRWGERRVAIAAIAATLASAGLLGWSALLAHPWVLATGMLLRGAGIGVLTLQAMAGAYAGLDRTQVAHASAWTRMLTQVGATLGASGVAIATQATQATPWLDRILPSGPFALAHGLLLLLSLACLLPARALAR